MSTSSLTSKVEMQCSFCGGTGVFRGLIEADGIGIICRDCNGSGKRTCEYIPFTKKNQRNDVQIVYAERDLSYADDSHTYGIPYSSFLEGEMPAKSHLKYSNV